MSERDVLPLRRQAESFNLTFGGQNAEFIVTIGRYPDGRIGEIFIDGAKIGSEVSAITRDAAVILSIALQFGAPIDTLRHAISREADNTAMTIMGAVLDKIHQQETTE